MKTTDDEKIESGANERKSDRVMWAMVHNVKCTKIMVMLWDVWTAEESCKHIKLLKLLHVKRSVCKQMKHMRASSALHDRI